MGALSAEDTKLRMYRRKMVLGDGGGGCSDGAQHRRIKDKDLYTF